MGLVKNIFMLLAAGALGVLRRLLGSTSAPTTPTGSLVSSRSWVKDWLVKSVVIGVALALVGGLLAVSGVIPIKASGGHWRVTSWLLDFSKRRSVKTHTLGIASPPLDDRRMILRGAGHYDLGCAPCHGSPKLEYPRIAQAMTPAPPQLSPRIYRWDPEELFYIVKHGIKFTGMPAWPAPNRDDEVWSVVAFLRTMPSLSPEQYRQVVSNTESAQLAPLEDLTPDDQRPRAVVENCARCHGYDGWGREGAFPIIAGQNRDYLLASLQAYACGQRHSGIMEPIARALTNETMQEVADYYAARQFTTGGTSSETTDFALGETIAMRGVPEQRVPACSSCHGPSDQPRNPVYPSLSGQLPDYLSLQLHLFRDGKRGGTAYSHIMRQVAGQLNPDQIRAVATYYGAIGKK